MRKLTATAAALLVGTSVLVANAQDTGNRAPFWPSIVGQRPVIAEWYSDIPWHQKLGTYAGDEIDEPLVLPYDALGPKETAYCAAQKPPLGKERCMLEVGVVNILGMYRTDTPYLPTDPLITAAPECKDASLPCVEVTLALSSRWTRINDAGKVELQARPFGTVNPDGNSYYGGYSITDGSTYAPQMAWYMAHYCDSQFGAGALDVQDPVCYGDYLSPMNSGFNAIGKGPTDWPRSVPWSVYPPDPNGPSNHCKEGDTTCTVALGGFALRTVPSDPTKLQYAKYNNLLLGWFNNALKHFPTDFSKAEGQRHFPWNGNAVTWETFLYPQALLNPYLGEFDTTQTAPANGPGCDVTATGPTISGCYNTAIVRASAYVYPRQCSLADLATGNAERLRQCGLNYELHHNGYLSQWPKSYWPDIQAAGMLANQYGRTSFLFAGVPGMQLPVTFAQAEGTDSGLSVYEQVYNSSIFSLYLPIANYADVTRAFNGRNYTDAEFFHTLLMSNHMESDPDEFAEGIRGKVMWHDEYRTQKMYDANATGVSKKFGARTFAASFDAATAPSPFHNNSCDGCHVRNGSGIPINPAGTLDVALQEYMTTGQYNPYPVKDYTFTGTIRPMKLVFFDLQRTIGRADASRFSEPLAFPALLKLNPPRTVQAGDLFYNNKIMNFYGDSFHATTPGYNFAWTYEAANSNSLVVGGRRVNAELGKTYVPLQVKLGTFQTSATCQLVKLAPTTKPWPIDCNDINDQAIHTAVEGGALGYMMLNGKRLNNMSATEAIPNQAIMAFRQAQMASLGATMAGEIVWNAGTRDGVTGDVKRTCRTKSLTDCYIGRFGWIGDRVSLEDQIANAAFVEMNVTTSQGYQQLYPGEKPAFPLRYDYPNCGPADQACLQSTGNADLTESDIKRMAAYARWLGSPTRSEFQVSLPEVVAGEKIFKQVKCDTCHVIKRVDIVPEDTMLSQEFRLRLATRDAQGATPFLSYIGTDLLMHDMGYLSQTGVSAQTIRDADGVVLPSYLGYIQKIRTPALKGLHMNRFVTDSHKNTKKPGDPACDFLLHDGRACDAIEAAFLHDGPAIKKLGVIDGLNRLSAQQILELRAFLYSL